MRTPSLHALGGDVPPCLGASEVHELVLERARDLAGSLTSQEQRLQGCRYVNASLID
jgi:hypothetical protein